MGRFRGLQEGSLFNWSIVVNFNEKGDQAYDRLNTPLHPWQGREHSKRHYRCDRLIKMLGNIEDSIFLAAI